MKKTLFQIRQTAKTGQPKETTIKCTQGTLFVLITLFDESRVGNSHFKVESNFVLEMNPDDTFSLKGYYEDRKRNVSLVESSFNGEKADFVGQEGAELVLYIISLPYHITIDGALEEQFNLRAVEESPYMLRELPNVAEFAKYLDEISLENTRIVL